MSATRARMAVASDSRRTDVQHQAFDRRLQATLSLVGSSLCAAMRRSTFGFTSTEASGPRILRRVGGVPWAGVRQPVLQLPQLGISNVDEHRRHDRQVQSAVNCSTVQMQCRFCRANRQCRLTIHTMIASAIVRLLRSTIPASPLLATTSEAVSRLKAASRNDSVN